GDAAAAGVEDEEAVAVLDRRVDGIGEEIALLVERDIADAAEQLMTAGAQVDEDDIGSARARWRGAATPRRSSAAALRRRRGTATRRAAASVLRTARGLRRTPLEEEMRRGRVEAEVLDVLPRLDRAGREIPQLGAPRRRRRRRGIAASLTLTAG